MGAIHLVVTLFLAAATTLLGVDAKTTGVSKAGLPHRAAPKYPETKKCDPTRCICTPQAYAEFYLQTPNLSGNTTTNPNKNNIAMPRPICVGKNLIGRVNGNAPGPASATLASVANGRTWAFVFDHAGLEKILALGQYRAKEVLAFLGFGTLSQFSCSPKENQNLIIIDLKDTSVSPFCKRKNPGDVYSSIPNSCNKANIMPAIWDNALPWLEQWYKMDLSYLEPAMNRIKSERFQSLTGCDPDCITTLGDNSNNATLLHNTCGCTTEFANAAQVFAAARYVCNKGAPEQRAAYPEKFLYYSRGQRGQKENYCESDVMLQALTGNDAVKLRAFFYAVNACNQYYTGYGYTANDYYLPQTPEFWINNFLYAKADWASVQLDCSISSDPVERLSISAASARRGYMPYLLAFDDEGI